MKRLLLVLTTHDLMMDGKSQTGVWLSSFTDAYYTLIEEGFEVVLASPKGGRAAIDPMSIEEGRMTDSCRRFFLDESAKEVFANTWKLDDVGIEEFDAMYVADGHGALWDLADNDKIAKLLYDAAMSGTPVAMVGHGVSVLKTRARWHPSPWKNIILTCFSDTEEALLKRHRLIPYDLKTDLLKAGAKYRSETVPFSSYVLTSGDYIFGQNPASSKDVAMQLAHQLCRIPA